MNKTVCMSRPLTTHGWGGCSGEDDRLLRTLESRVDHLVSTRRDPSEPGGPPGTSGCRRVHGTHNGPSLSLTRDPSQPHSSGFRGGTQGVRVTSSRVLPVPFGSTSVCGSPVAPWTTSLRVPVPTLRVPSLQLSDFQKSLYPPVRVLNFLFPNRYPLPHHPERMGIDVLRRYWSLFLFFGVGKRTPLPPG